MANENVRVITRENATAADKAARTTVLVPSGSRFLKASDFKSKSMIVTISGYEVATVGDPPKPQIVLHFGDLDPALEGKVLGLNVGNRQVIEGHTGSKTPFELLDWKIRLYTTVATFNGQKFDVIRVSDEWAEGPDAVSF